MAERELVYIPIRLEPESYEALKRLVGPRKVSPTIRRMVEEYVEQEPVRRRIEEQRRQQEANRE